MTWVPATEDTFYGDDSHCCSRCCCGLCGDSVAQMVNVYVAAPANLCVSAIVAWLMVHSIRMIPNAVASGAPSHFRCHWNTYHVDGYYNNGDGDRVAMTTTMTSYGWCSDDRESCNADCILDSHWTVSVILRIVRCSNGYGAMLMSNVHLFPANDVPFALLKMKWKHTHMVSSVKATK